MSKYVIPKKCEHEGCREITRFHFDSKREMKESTSLNRPWRCTRHHNPDSVMSPENRIRTMVLTSGKSSKHPHLTNLFWFADGATWGSGFVYGPGFKAFTEDFPEGTRIRITAEILPAVLTTPTATARG